MLVTQIRPSSYEWILNLNLCLLPTCLRNHDPTYIIDWPTQLSYKKKLGSIYLPHVPTPISNMSLVMVTPIPIILDDNTNLTDITGYITYPTNIEAKQQDRLCVNLFNS
jgi:hypothetical protein